MTNKYRPKDLPTPRDCERYRRPRTPERYGNRTAARALIRHPAWMRYMTGKLLRQAAREQAAGVEG